MNIELIPVIEITYFNSAPSPEKGPWWEYQDDWENYAQIRLKNAGFIDEFKPYKKGSSFYEPHKLSFPNLKKLIIDWFESFDGSNLDDILPFYGGYVLKVDNKDVYFPQCCGDLGDIVYWEKIIKENKNCYYNGHPAPLISFSQSEVTFTFDETDEQFSPPTPDSLALNLNVLEKALNKALKKLKEFEQNILKVSDEVDLKLKGEQLTEILIYRNQEIKN